MELTRLALVAAVRCFWLQKRLQPNTLWRLSNSNGVLFLQWAGVEYRGTNGRLETSWCTICRLRVYRGYSEFFWSV